MQELDALRSLADPDRAAQMAAYHKAARTYLGLQVPQIEALVAEWRAARDVGERVALAASLWDSDIHEARVAAAKLLTQARIRPDQAVWNLIASWAPQFDAWAIADHAMTAGQKRLVADPDNVPIAKLIAARRLLDAAKAGNEGRANTELVINHTDGKAVQRIETTPVDTRSIQERMEALRAKLEPLFGPEQSDN